LTGRAQAPRPALRLRRTNLFTEDAELQRRLAELEQNVVRVVTDADRDKQNAQRPTSIQTADYQAALDELVICDTTAAAFTVKLPRTARSDAGRQLTVKRLAGANLITVRPFGEALIDQQATATVTSTVRRFHFDGRNWWVV
jgi:hypothetical protein